jgi:hypothetical protein
MPAPTVESAEARLLVRCGAWMGLAGLSTAPSFPNPPNVPNPSTMYAITDAAKQLGVNCVGGAPVDADLAGFDTPPEEVKFGELAELALLETILISQPQLASSSTRSESFESHTISESSSNSSGSSGSPLTGRIDFLRKKYKTILDASAGSAGIRAGAQVFAFPHPRQPTWGIGYGRVDH